MKPYVGRYLSASIVLFLVTVAYAAEKHPSASYDTSLRRGETRTTLDPNMFADPTVKKAYRVAMEIPWVLSIYCNCQCEESPTFRHKSLLSCYVDAHASM